MPRLVQVRKSRRSGKKWDAIFEMPKGRSKTVSFGATGQQDQTMHHDNERRRRQIQRHSRREPFRDPTKAGTLARQILWEKPTVKSAVAAYKRRFRV